MRERERGAALLHQREARASLDPRVQREVATISIGERELRRAEDAAARRARDAIHGLSIVHEQKATRTEREAEIIVEDIGRLQAEGHIRDHRDLRPGQRIGSSHFEDTLRFENKG